MKLTVTSAIRRRLLPIGRSPPIKAQSTKIPYIIRCKKEWIASIGKWRILLYDGGIIGPRLQKGDDWPDYPQETDTEEDASFYIKAWEKWMNNQNKGLKNYMTTR